MRIAFLVLLSCAIILLQGCVTSGYMSVGSSHQLSSSQRVSGSENRVQTYQASSSSRSSASTSTNTRFSFSTP